MIASKHAFTFILKMILPFKWAIIVILTVAVVWALRISVTPYILKIILDRLVESPLINVFEVLMTPVIVYILIAFITTTSSRIYGYVVELKMIPNLRQKIAESSFSRLIDQSHYYYQDQFSGSLASKINDLTTSVPDVVRIVLDRFFSHFLAIAIAIVALGTVNLKFSLLMLTWAIFFIGTSFLFFKKLTYLSDKWSEWGATITGKIVDGLSNILSIRLFSRKNQENNSLNQTFQEAIKAEQKLQWAYLGVWCIQGYSYVIMLGINLYFLMKDRQMGLVTIGDFALVLTINASVIDLLWALTKEFSDFSKFFGRITQALRTIFVIPEIQDKQGAKALVVSKGRIIFNKVHFCYKNAPSFFQDKSITILPGQRVGLVGYSGSGKSTFVNLILRLFEVTSGQILIDDQNIREVTQDSLHENISMIPQDPSLFHRSLRENIRYGRLDATDKEIIDAAIRAQAHDFISVLPNGYDTLVGERGVKLSGGQRQRIAIARAILKNAPFLILDEATSQLDSVTESYIQESLWKIMQGKTTLVIAHRLSTLNHMDRILVFEEGKIVEDGTHEDLFVKSGLYKTLWDTQAGGFLPEKKK